MHDRCPTHYSGGTFWRRRKQGVHTENHVRRRDRRMLGHGPVLEPLRRLVPEYKERDNYVSYTRSRCDGVLIKRLFLNVKVHVHGDLKKKKNRGLHIGVP